MSPFNRSYWRSSREWPIPKFAPLPPKPKPVLRPHPVFRVEPVKPPVFKVLKQPTLTTWPIGSLLFGLSVGKHWRIAA